MELFRMEVRDPSEYAKILESVTGAYVMTLMLVVVVCYGAVRLVQRMEQKKAEKQIEYRVYKAVQAEREKHEADSLDKGAAHFEETYWLKKENRELKKKLEITSKENESMKKLLESTNVSGKVRVAKVNG